LSITGTGTNLAVYGGQIQLAGGALWANGVGSKFYAVCYGMVTNADAQQLSVKLYPGTGDILETAIVATPTINTVYKLSGIFTQTNQSGAGSIRIKHSYADAATANTKVMQVQKVMLEPIIGLPELALSDANLLTWCDNNIPTWFDGTMNRLGGLGWLR